MQNVDTIYTFRLMCTYACHHFFKIIHIISCVYIYTPNFGGCINFANHLKVAVNVFFMKFNEGRLLYSLGNQVEKSSVALPSHVEVKILNNAYSVHALDEVRCYFESYF